MVIRVGYRVKDSVGRERKKALAFGIHFAMPTSQSYRWCIRGRFSNEDRPCRRITILAIFALWLLCPLPVPSVAEGATHVDIVRDRFQQLLDQWGYHEWWSMWGQGIRQSRAAISKDAFAQKMDSTLWQLVCCDKRLRNLQITPVSSQHVVVSATLLFETKGSPRSVQERPYPINLNFYLEEEQWRVDLLSLGHP
jgi:hypothetical protein